MMKKSYHMGLLKVNRKSIHTTSSDKNRLEDDRRVFITMLITLSLRLHCTLMTESSTAPDVKGSNTEQGVVIVFMMEHTQRDHKGATQANVL
jgi:hypothetical protein